MTEFIFNILWTICVALFTMFSEILAAKFISLRNTVTQIDSYAKSNESPDEILARIKNRLKDYNSKTSPVWGAELSAVALSVDFAALGIWITNSNLFPFFNTIAGGGHQIPVWLLLFLVHFVAFASAIIIRQLHLELSNTSSKWLYIGNSIGFLSLFSCFTILTNAI